LLGARLRTCTQLVLNIQQRSIAEIFGHPDDLKFHSSMTLFAQFAPTTACSIKPWSATSTAFWTNGRCNCWTQNRPSCPPIRVEKSSSTNGRIASATGCSCG
jgi:hypothetical protein